MEEINFDEIVDLVHSILCFKDHPQACKFEVESQCVDAMDLEDHKKWSDITTHLYKACGATSLTDLLDMITESSEVISLLTTRTSTIILTYIQAALDSDSQHAFKDQFTQSQTDPNVTSEGQQENVW